MERILLKGYIDSICRYFQEIRSISKKVRNYDYLVQQKSFLEVQVGSLNSRVKDLENSVADRNLLSVRCDELSKRLGDYGVVVGERDSLRGKVGEYQKVIDERNRLIAFQRRTIAELRESGNGKKFVYGLELYNQEKSSKNIFSQIASYFSRRFCKKDSKLASTLIVKYGLSANEASSILHSEGILGLCKKRAFLINERRKALGKNDVPFKCLKKS